MTIKKSSHSMRSDGRIVVDVNTLLTSDKVKKDLAVLRSKIDAADAERARKQQIDSGRLAQ